MQRAGPHDGGRLFQTVDKAANRSLTRGPLLSLPQRGRVPPQRQVRENAATSSGVETRPRSRSSRSPSSGLRPPSPAGGRTPFVTLHHVFSCQTHICRHADGRGKPLPYELYYSLIKTFNYPRATSDTADGFVGQALDGITQAINDLLKRLEYFIMEAPGTKLFPDLLNRIHLWGVRRYEHQFYVWSDLQGAGFVPSCPIANKNDVIIWIRCR